KWNLLDDAERLCHEALDLGVKYTQFESSPERLLARVDEARRKEVELMQAARQPSREAASTQRLPDVPSNRAVEAPRGAEALPRVAVDARKQDAVRMLNDA